MSARTTESGRSSTLRSLLRLYPYARPAMPRIALGMLVALGAGVVALLIPQVLRELVDGPLGSGDASQVWPAFAIVLGLGIVEAVMVYARRAFVLTPGTHVEARLRNGLYAKLQRLP